jgi:hypothetical protein
MEHRGSDQLGHQREHSRRRRRRTAATSGENTVSDSDRIAFVNERDDDNGAQADTTAGVAIDAWVDIAVVASQRFFGLRRTSPTGSPRASVGRQACPAASPATGAVHHVVTLASSTTAPLASVMVCARPATSAITLPRSRPSLAISVWVAMMASSCAAVASFVCGVDCHVRAFQAAVNP